jgi:hypothetical protein
MMNMLTSQACQHFKSGVDEYGTWVKLWFDRGKQMSEKLSVLVLTGFENNVEVSRSL